MPKEQILKTVMTQAHKIIEASKHKRIQHLQARNIKENFNIKRLSNILTLKNMTSRSIYIIKEKHQEKKNLRILCTRLSKNGNRFPLRVYRAKRSIIT